MTAPSFTPPVIEDKEHTFICEARGGNPGAVITWHVNGLTVDDGVMQNNTTDTQTSTLTLSPYRSMHTVGCSAEQLPPRPPVFGENMAIDVFCK